MNQCLSASALQVLTVCVPYAVKKQNTHHIFSLCEGW